MTYQIRRLHLLLVQMTRQTPLLLLLLLRRVTLFKGFLPLLLLLLLLLLLSTCKRTRVCLRLPHSQHGRFAYDILALIFTRQNNKLS